VAPEPEIQDAVRGRNRPPNCSSGYRALHHRGFLAVLQQITGVIPCFTYGSLIFRDRGPTKHQLGARPNDHRRHNNFLATIRHRYHRQGRPQPLLLASSAGMAVSLVVLGAVRVHPVPAMLVVLG
jgi:hypothetical protein